MNTMVDTNTLSVAPSDENLRHVRVTVRHRRLAENPFGGEGTARYTNLFFDTIEEAKDAVVKYQRRDMEGRDTAYIMLTKTYDLAKHEPTEDDKPVDGPPVTEQFLDKFVWTSKSNWQRPKDNAQEHRFIVLDEDVSDEASSDDESESEAPSITEGAPF